MNPIAELFVTIGADLSSLKKSLDGAASQMKTQGNKLGDAFSGALKVGLGAAVVGIGALTAGLVASVKAAQDAEEGQAQLNAVLASTGGKAGVTADMANELASSLQKVTRFEDDTVLAGENMLLTFTNIGKDVFPMATQTMLDMSQALGQDVKSSAIQLGKALNDPIKGITALSRVGVTFTDKQKDLIKSLVDSGKTMEAQKVILAELKTEFGGAATAAGQTFAGKMDILNHTFGDLQETIGAAVIPILDALATKLLQALNSEWVQNFVKQISYMFEVLASGDDVAQGLFEIFDNLFGPTVGNGVRTIAGLFEKTLIPAFENFTNNVLPKWEWKVTDVFVQGVAEVQKFWNGIQPTLKQFEGWLTTDGVAALDVFYTKLKGFSVPQSEFNNLLREMGTTFTLTMRGITSDSNVTFPSLAQLIGLSMDKILADSSSRLVTLTGIFRTANAAIRGDWAQVFKVELPNLLQDSFNLLMSTIGVDGARLGDVWRQQIDNLIAILMSMRGMFSDVATQMVQGLIDGFNSQAAAISATLWQIISDAIDNIKNLLGIHSPSTVFMEMGINMGLGMVQGVARGLAGLVPQINEEMKKLPDFNNGGLAFDRKTETPEQRMQRLRDRLAAGGGDPENLRRRIEELQRRIDLTDLHQFGGGLSGPITINFNGVSVPQTQAEANRSGQMIITALRAKGMA